ncbi:M15 family metallopeptidase, partial [Flavobacteriales bacterium]|nr:M15 family metallopeptidase [Flavobacteriales bacterium]
RISLISLLILGVIYWKRKLLANMALDTIHLFLGDTWDRHTDRRIGFLHPIIRERATAFINKMDKEQGIKLRITSDGHFRSFEKQDELYSRGRSQAGRIITNAKAGESYHNYGLAFDLVEIKDGKALWDNPNWNRIGEMGKSFGFNWGGDWRSFKDYPHFELSNGYDLADLKWKYLNGDVRDGYVVV